MGKNKSDERSLKNIIEIISEYHENLDKHTSPDDTELHAHCFSDFDGWGSVGAGERRLPVTSFRQLEC